MFNVHVVSIASRASRFGYTVHVLINARIKCALNLENGHPAYMHLRVNLYARSFQIINTITSSGGSLNFYLPAYIERSKVLQFKSVYCFFTLRLGLSWLNSTKYYFGVYVLRAYNIEGKKWHFLICFVIARACRLIRALINTNIILIMIDLNKINIKHQNIKLMFINLINCLLISFNWGNWALYSRMGMCNRN